MARRVQGLDRLRRKLAKMPAEAKAEIGAALVRSGDEMASLARALAPVRTGDLRESIVVTLPGQHTPLFSQPGGRHAAGELQVLVTAGNYFVRYAHLAEHGHAKAAARPFFWPAYRAMRKRIRGRINRAIRSAARKVAAS